MDKNDLIYLDNAATSYPKPYAVCDAVKKYMLYCGGNAGRGGYSTAMQAAEGVFDCRMRLSKFFDSPQNGSAFFTVKK